MPQKKKQSTALVKFEERLAAAALNATKTVAQVGGGGNFVSLKSGVLSYQKAIIPENKMRVMVMAQLLENQWFDKPFTEGEPASPACYAYGDDRKDMAPDPQHVEEPVASSCNGCELKEFGSADRGRGKACGDVIRLSLITEGDMENIEAAELAYVKVPYFSTLEWAGYVRQLSEVHHKSPVGSIVDGEGVPPGFITEITLVPDKKSQFRLKFRMVEEIEFNEENFEALAAKTKEACAAIAFPYPKFEEGGAKKPAAKKKQSAAERIKAERAAKKR